MALTKTILSPRDEWKTAKNFCVQCGKFHPSQSHWEFMQTMPQDPLEMISDLTKMGVYKPATFDIANSLSTAELRKELFLKMAGKGSPKREKLVLELAKQAGGLDNAFSAAFGAKAGEFFGDAIRSGEFSRRKFLQNVAIGAALVSLVNACGNNAGTPESQPDAPPPDTSNLEKTDLKVGFIPITCATPIIMSEPLGFYQKYGLNAQVVKMPSWGAVRDSAIAGELDAYHMLAPMPIAMTLGLGSATFGVRLASIENINGQAITVSNKYKGKINGPADFKGFVLGVPFPYSMHNLLLRYYLATGGINPDVDVTIRPVPPPDSIAQLVAGDIDGFLMPDPFNQRAVYEDAGFIHKLTKELWPGHPCCAFAASDTWINENPNTFRALNKSIIEATGYASKPENRVEIAEAISDRAFLNQPVEVVQAVLTGKFEDGLGNNLDVPDRIDFDPYPWQSFANWIMSQLVRWDISGDGKAKQLTADGKYDQLGQEIFLTDLARELAEELGQTPPDEIYRTETLEFDTFDPQQPDQYIQAQIDKYGF
ncbi:CmpA/NrtA family ABC transporter substrate-binding protein [Cyanobacterium aponinum UTEX 3222]|uniref:Taurine ABC transporter substrate-binding protein n=3 Tax=Cyanobacterium aponinum TaxID=379064 RepID=A0A844GZB6_9CHRO|nr:CmpA/NrtA family ABC transporter substrate-binding protein [Cyanobacterium aponinum]WRL42855.1 CmpA/NrtA family ABC transporter substrate-binding protein [Cyanobacterium aponinum UTEX 3222]AFZ55157.1 putative cyanate ABC transporter, substrate binding protein [Cyanobacterium aponinum PCC 10605]MTF39306.1 taurine ABC transporter substrate-binding protein [Cyanobacterium aponinum 0216]PHV63423.1 taurine ABC transporter substrate-binding protein [Cyanobacterium aponinum IPPAS B-1201]WPF88309.1